METNYDEMREKIMRDKNNLKGFDESTGKQNIQLMLDDILDYPNCCEAFVLATRYSDFEFVKATQYDEDPAGYDAFYKLDGNSYEGDFDANITIMIAKTAQEAHVAITNYVNSATSMQIYPASLDGIIVGDLAVGNKEKLTFIRGNVYVQVIGYEVSIVNLAQEIDQQILDIVSNCR